MLRSWCTQNGYSHGKSMSHVLMDGGVLSIPDTKVDEFYKVYINSVTNGEQVFVVEQKTDIYNFFMDIDYKDDEPLSITEIESITKMICDKIQTVLVDVETTKCMISVAQPKRKDGMIKTGVHLNWDTIPVDKDAAIKLMTHVVNMLNSVYSSKDWSKYIDQSVYGDPHTSSKGSGFRMPWSHKKGKHDECGGKGCIVCDHTGKLTEGEYLPVFMYDNNTLTSLDQTPTLANMYIATIRSRETVPTKVLDIIIRPPRRPKGKKEGDFTSTQVREVFDNSEATVHLESFIRKYIDGQHNSRVLQIFKYSKTFLVKTDSKYCENIRRSHNSNHIWFLISVKKKTICQKCFCRCDTTKGRRYGMCKDFSSREHLLAMNSTLSRLLFKQA